MVLIEAEQRIHIPTLQPNLRRRMVVNLFGISVGAFLVACSPISAINGEHTATQTPSSKVASVVPEIETYFGKVTSIIYPNGQTDPSSGTINLEFKPGLFLERKDRSFSISSDFGLHAESSFLYTEGLLATGIGVGLNTDPPTLKDEWANLFYPFDPTPNHRLSFSWTNWKITQVTVDSNIKRASLQNVPGNSPQPVNPNLPVT